MTGRQLALFATSLARAAGATAEHHRGRGVDGRQVGRSGLDAVAAQLHDLPIGPWPGLGVLAAWAAAAAITSTLTGGSATPEPGG